MRSIVRQTQRGVFSYGFLLSTCILIFALLYVHMDAGLFWRNPAAYFSSGDFYYTFIISVYLGLMRFLLPLCAVLPLSMAYAEDVDTRFIFTSLHRQPPTKYAITRILSAIISSSMAVVVAFSLVTVTYLLVCPVEFQNDSFQVLAMQSPYGWRASPEFFHVFILEAVGRLLLSASLWACIGLTFSAIWPNRVFVIVSTLAFAYASDGWLMKVGGVEWTISYLQAPDFSVVRSLIDPLTKQLAFLAIGAVVCYFSLCSALSAKVHGLLHRLQATCSRLADYLLPPQHLWLPHVFRATRLGQLWADFRSFISPLSILCILVVTSLCISLAPVVSYSRYSIGELLLSTFGGIQWADPNPDIYGIGRWLLLLLPSMMGVAYTVNRELSGRQMITINRYGSSQRWWASKVAASVLYAILCVIIMFAWTILLGWLMGARGLQVYVTDADGFRTAGNGILSTMFVQFLLQVVMWTQIQMIFHLVFIDMRAGIIAYLLPLITMLMSASNIETPRNIWIPVNWGMVFRTELFCISGYMLDGGEWLQLCAVAPFNAILLHILVILALLSLHVVCSRFVKLTNVSYTK